MLPLILMVGLGADIRMAAEVYAFALLVFATVVVLFWGADG